MSPKNVDLVRTLFDAWNDVDPDRVAALMSEEVTWLEVEGRPEVAGPHEVRGREAVVAGLEELFETWEHYRVEVEELREAGDGRVIAMVSEVARGRTSGVELSSRWGYVLTIADGKLVRIEAYRNADEAVDSVGDAG